MKTKTRRYISYLALIIVNAYLSCLTERGKKEKRKKNTIRNFFEAFVNQQTPNLAHTLNLRNPLY